LNLSIIIPTKNEAQYLTGCISRVKKAIAFWGGDAEILVADNGSTDKTVEIAKKFGCYVETIPLGTIAEVRNSGANKAKGDIIAFLDADCYVTPKWIDFCLQNLQHKDIAATGTRAIPDLEHSTWVERSWYNLMTGAPRKDFVDWLGTSNIFLKAVVFHEVGGFTGHLMTSEDVDLCLKIRRKGYKIKLEKRIVTTHMRESKTLYQLYKREYWRGSSSISALLKSDSISKEILSVLVPVVNGCAIILALTGYSNSFFLTSLISLLIVVLFPLLLIARKKALINGISSFMAIYMVAFTYIFARTVSTCVEILKALKSLLSNRFQKIVL